MTAEPSNDSPYWLVEYEIPPMRAIYTACFSMDGYMRDEDSVRQLIGEHEPLWRVRKVTKVVSVTP